MELETAKILLNQCVREELQDHAFGDVEVFWFKDGQQIAGGYFGDGYSEVWLTPQTKFGGAEAKALKGCGATGHVERNDTTGPDKFVSGHIESGLTKEAVLKEITNAQA